MWSPLGARNLVARRSENGRPAVLIYAEPLLAPSMTFVRSQGQALTAFSPYYIAPYYDPKGLNLPEAQIVVMRQHNDRWSRLADLPFKRFGFAPLFFRRLRALQPTVLHAHFGPMGVRVLPLARSLNIPLVVTFHGYDATTPDQLALASDHYSHRVYIRRRAELNRRASLLIAVSGFVRNKLIEQGFAPEKVRVHYIGVDTSCFRPDANMQRQRTLLFTGRLEAVKGCDYLIRAMALVQATLPDVNLVIVGDGSKRRELEHLATRKLKNCTFVGFQTPDLVKEWMNRAQVFAAPSVRTSDGSEEGCGLALLEAQAMGLPVVSFLSGGIPEIVAHGETGFLSPEKEHEALAQNIILLFRNETLCRRMGEAGRERVKLLFDLGKQTRQLEEMYTQVGAGIAQR